LYKRRKEKGYLFRAPAPPRPAHEVALEALEELLGRNLLEQGAYKQFYSEISEIVRRYIEGRYFIRALEETSYEILQDMKDQDLTDELYRMLAEFLNLADLVKFAKYVPDQQENENVVVQARRLVMETKVILEPEIKDSEPILQTVPEKEVT
jgi:hypothetical protein